MSNLVFIGMPGAGKSTIGVVLAKVKGYQFIDSDILIQEKEGKLLSEIIAQKGVEGFIQVENDVNASIKAENSIIATGGSVVYGTEAMEHLKKLGTVIYLKLSFEELDRRLNNIKGRGVVLRDGQTLYDLYEERTVLYEKYADIIIDEENCNVEETIDKIIHKITPLQN